MGPLCPPSGTGPAPVSALCTPGALSHRWDPQNCSQFTSSSSSAPTPTAQPLGAPGPNSGAFKVGKTSLFLTAVFSPQEGSSRAKSTWKPKSEGSRCACGAPTLVPLHRPG